MHVNAMNDMGKQGAPVGSAHVNAKNYVHSQAGGTVGGAHVSAKNYVPTYHEICTVYTA